MSLRIKFIRTVTDFGENASKVCKETNNVCICSLSIQLNRFCQLKRREKYKKISIHIQALKMQFGVDFERGEVGLVD